jgi:hypothetical protein
MSNFQTRKSFKSTLRDKPKHSDKVDRNGAEPKKSGGGGKFTWGKPGDELKQNRTDPNDPNYDEEGTITYSEAVYSPTEHKSEKFTASISDYNRFKANLKQAAKEYLNSLDSLEFATIIKELDLSIYHQDVVYIIIKFSLDCPPEQRNCLEKLITYLYKQQHITANHIAASIRKLYNQINDLMIDCPSALPIIRESVSYLVTSGELNSSVEIECEKSIKAQSNPEQLSQIKAKAKDIFTEFFSGEDGDEAADSVYELKSPELHFEVVKILISLALDRGNRQRELASKFIATFAGDLLQHEAIERAFSILIERVEDLYLDIPNILRLLSGFLARAVVDEALAPAFLARQDIAETDLGAQVCGQAAVLIKQPNALEILQDIWADLPAKSR